MQIASSNNSTATFAIQPTKSSWPQPEPRQNFSDILTPEQKNTVQQGVDDKIAEQVENVKSNYQTAKDIDLMQSYYQQQQKLFDVYLQTSTDGNATTATTQVSEKSSAVSTLTNAYAELYQLHRTVKEGVGQLPEVGISYERIQSLPTSSVTQTNETINSAASQSTANKQLDAYNSLMMPSTSSYVHFSA
jgi:hypothetical protein